MSISFENFLWGMVIRLEIDNCFHDSEQRHLINVWKCKKEKQGTDSIFYFRIPIAKENTTNIRLLCPPTPAFER